MTARENRVNAIPSEENRELRPLAALAMVALIARAVRTQLPADRQHAQHNAATREQAVKFAECMRANGVREFPDPDASGTLTIDGIANGSSLDTSSAAFKQAIAACKDLQPPGFTATRGAPSSRRRPSSSPSASATTA